MKRLIILSFLLWLPNTALGTDSNIHYTILEGEKAKLVSGQCSRENPPKIDEIWVPDLNTILRLESQLKVIEALTPELCCLANVKITDVFKYYRQYVGIVSNGKRLIYINAFLLNKPPKDWKTEPVIVCDGGEGFWGAVFDPQSGEFSALSINGVA
jgi:hypothetical protein